MVDNTEGSGIVHIAPGCGAEDFELGESLGLDKIIPIDESGYIYDGFGFLSGMNAKEVTDLYAAGNYNPMEHYINDSRIRTVIDQLTNGFFETVPQYEFEEIRNNLLYRDPYLVLRDFASYVDAQAKANELYKNRKLWTKMSIMNTAKSGFFTTDRTMQEYNKDIWHLNKVKTTWVKKVAKKEEDYIEIKPTLWQRIKKFLFS